MLHRLSRLTGFHIHATDGEIGHIDDVVVDERTWRVQYLVVDTSNLIGGTWVAMSPAVLRTIDWAKGEVEVSVSRDDIKRAPRLESLDVPPSEALPNYAFIF